MIQRLRQMRNEEGFTLIELLIVIIVLGILAAIVVFAVGSTRGDAKAAACNTDVKSVQLSAEAMKTKNGFYPQTAPASPTGAGGALLKTMPAGIVYAPLGGDPATGYSITPTPAVTDCNPVTG